MFVSCSGSVVPAFTVMTDALDPAPLAFNTNCGDAGSIAGDSACRRKSQLPKFGAPVGATNAVSQFPPAATKSGSVVPTVLPNRNPGTDPYVTFVEPLIRHVCPPVQLPEKHGVPVK